MASSISITPTLDDTARQNNEIRRNILLSANMEVVGDLSISAGEYSHTFKHDGELLQLTTSEGEAKIKFGMFENAPGIQAGDEIIIGYSNSFTQKPVQTTGNGIRPPVRTADPTEDLYNGLIYYNSTTHKLRAYINGAWTSLN